MEPGPECETFEQFELSVFQRIIDDAIINLHSNLANGDDEQNQNLPIAERNLLKDEIEVYLSWRNFFFMNIERVVSKKIILLVLPK